MIPPRLTVLPVVLRLDSNVAPGLSHLLNFLLYCPSPRDLRNDGDFFADDMAKNVLWLEILQYKFSTVSPVFDPTNTYCFLLMRDWNWEIVQMVRKFPTLRSERKKRTTSGGSPQLSNGFSGKLLFHLTFNRNFRIFLLNGKHPRNLRLARKIRAGGGISKMAGGETNKKQNNSQHCAIFVIERYPLGRGRESRRYILVIQRFLVVYYGISHESLVFSRYTHEPLGECVYEENTSDKWDIP